MTESVLRKRRQQLAYKKPITQKDVSAVRASNNDVIPMRPVLFFVCFCAFCFFLYQRPHIIHGTLGTWTGALDRGPSVPDTSLDDGPRIISADLPKRDAVVQAFKHAWLAYERDAMGDDEYHPISHKGSNLTQAGGIGYTVIDCIDTMLIMGLKEEYGRARDWVEHRLSFDRNADFNTFETTIRILGGLLSAYHLSGGDGLFLERAKDLADRLLPAFDTSTGLPLSMVNLGLRLGVPLPDLPDVVSISEISTLQLEFRYLSFLTDDGEYWDKVERVMAIIKKARLPHGLVPIYMSIVTGTFLPSEIRLGSRGDSYYEYLLKQYIQTNQTERVYRDMYDNAMQGIHTHLLQKSPKAQMTHTCELIPERRGDGKIVWRLKPKQDHLVCFLGGSLMLGATTAGALVHPVSLPPRPSELSDSGKRDWRTGVELIETCLRTHDTATGLSPEIVHFKTPNGAMHPNSLAPWDWYIKGARPGERASFDARYILRPETVESLFIAFRVTGDERYRQHGWNIFQSIEKHCRVETGGYTSIINVDEVPAQREDKMETFFMGETLKYLYLLFSDSDVLPLNEYVFNTEAHPLPIFHPTIRTGFS